MSPPRPEDDLGGLRPTTAMPGTAGAAPRRPPARGAPPPAPAWTQEVGERGGYHAELARVWGPPGYPPREFPPTVRKLSEDDIAVQGPGIYELQPMVRHPNGKVVPAGDHPRRIEVSEALWRAAMLRAGRGAELPPDPHFEPEPEPEAEADEPPPPGAGGDSSALWWRMGQAVEGLRADVRNMRQPAPQAGPGGVPADPFYSQHGERMVPASLLSEVREQLTDQHSKAVAEYERRITRLENDHEKALRDLETRLRGSHTAELAVVEAKLEAATERREGMRRELDRMQSDLDDKRVELREARLAAIEAKGGGGSYLDQLNARLKEAELMEKHATAMGFTKGATGPGELEQSAAEMKAMGGFAKDLGAAAADFVTTWRGPEGAGGGGGKPEPDEAIKKSMGILVSTLEGGVRDKVAGDVAYRQLKPAIIAQDGGADFLREIAGQPAQDFKQSVYRFCTTGSDLQTLDGGRFLDALHAAAAADHR